MTRRNRFVLGLAGALFLVFGLTCLNYTQADGLEHHREFGRLHGLPPPTNGILYSGVPAVVLGASTVGSTVGRRAGA